MRASIDRIGIAIQHDLRGQAASILDAGMPWAALPLTPRKWVVDNVTTAGAFLLGRRRRSSRSPDR